SSHGSEIVSGGHDATLRRWDVATGRCLLTFPVTDGTPVSLVEVSPDGGQIVSVRFPPHSRHSTATLWKLGRLGLATSDRSSLQLARPEPLPDVIRSAARRIEFLALAETAITGGRINDALRFSAELEALPGQRRHPQVVEMRRRVGA